MNILFLTTGRMESIEQHAIYPDLLRQFRNHGHRVYCVSSFEKRVGRETEYIEDHGAHMLHVKIDNLTKTNIIEKGISTLRIEGQFLSAIRKYLSTVRFDLILYSTPPITLANVISYVKKRDGAKTYLLLKDIFPQNAVDIGLMTKTGVKGLLYRYFRQKEKKLYALSDRIGCMSQANVDYLLSHNPDIDPNKVEICPNSIEPQDIAITETQRMALRAKYDIPQDRTVFVYGGNLGKPQGIPFLIECLKKLKNHPKAFFLIVGDGTEYGKLQSFMNEENPQNVKLLKRLPKDDYDRMISACDIGLIFLDHRFTIPNFPSRLLAYMQAGLPVLACTDPNTDIGKVIVERGFGWWCESDDAENFVRATNESLCTRNEEMSWHARNYLEINFDVKKVYEKTNWMNMESKNERENK